MEFLRDWITGHIKGCDKLYPERQEELRELFEAEGLSLMGVADPVLNEAGEAEYREWLRRNFHGSMSYMERHAAAKFRPGELLSGCRSILVVGLNYYQDAPDTPEGAGRVARYAWGRDYHKVLGNRLKRIRRRLEEAYPGERFRNFTDATPLAERYYAERAGIGFQGRNTLLISSQYGSWFLIGEILSTRHFPASSPEEARHGACPSSCRKCIDVCPTGALYAPHRIDASRCISYLTIEHKGSIPEELRPRIGNWLFGCDLCQEVCPLNVRRQVTGESDFLRINAGAAVELREILSIPDEESFKERFAGSPLMRAGRIGLIRNACIVAANNGARELLPELRRLTTDKNEVIAEHAEWAVRRLEG
ncbi:MAG: tRNA epoxyqueuosine(34) reductase QueG [Spirochaetaceae bacterium]